MTYLPGYACEESIDSFQIFFQNEFVMAKVQKRKDLQPEQYNCSLCL